MFVLTEVESDVLQDIWGRSDKLLRGPSVGSFRARHHQDVRAIDRLEAKGLVLNNGGQYCLTRTGFLYLKDQTLGDFRGHLARVFRILRECFVEKGDDAKILLDELSKLSNCEADSLIRCISVLSLLGVGLSGTYANPTGPGRFVHVSYTIADWKDLSELEQQAKRDHEQQHPRTEAGQVLSNVQQLLMVEAHSPCTSIDLRRTDGLDNPSVSGAPQRAPAPRTASAESSGAHASCAIDFAGKNFEIGRSLLNRLPLTAFKQELASVLRLPWRQKEFRNSKLLAFGLCWEFMGPADACARVLYSHPPASPDWPFIKKLRELVERGSDAFPVDALHNVCDSCEEELRRIPHVVEELKAVGSSVPKDQRHYLGTRPQLHEHLTAIQTRVRGAAIEKEAAALATAPAGGQGEGGKPQHVHEHYNSASTKDSFLDIVERRGNAGSEISGDTRAILEGRVRRFRFAGLTYEVIRQRGKGGNAVVLETQALESKALLGESRSDAIKIFFPDNPAFRDEKTRERFRREFQFLGEMNHPNLVRVYAFDQMDDGSPAYSMELLPQTLADVLKHQDKISNDEKLRWTRDLFETLAHVHGLNPQDPSFHRDLHPRNLFITTDGRLKIGDWGIAHITVPVTDETATVLTDGVEPLHNRPYAAPEQRDSRFTPITSAVDVFSAALITYELYVGQLPKALPKTFDPDAPRALRTITASAFHTDPTQRPTAGEVALRLAEVSGERGRD